MNSKDTLDKKAVENFQKYLQIPSVQPDPDYNDCVEFLKQIAGELDLPIQVCDVAPKKPVVLLTWKGKKSALPTILLNSHMDVVPVFEEKWTHKPFGAEIVDGRIYARGAQDMKCVGIQYLEAIRRLRLRGVELERTVYVSFVPDEEIGGIEGMEKFVKMQDFKDLNVGFAMDESVASANEEFIIFYAERYMWEPYFHCTGPSGHGSFMRPNTAGEKATYIMNKINEFRNTEMHKAGINPLQGDITSINVTQLSGGVQANVVPSEFTIGMDCRIPVTTDAEEFEEILNQWCKEAGEDVWIEYGRKGPKTPATVLDDSNPYWVAVKSAFDNIGLKVKTVICPGGTDARYLRAEGVAAIGFSPMNNTEALLHNHDENLSLETFLEGIEIYCSILMKLGNVIIP